MKYFHLDIMEYCSVFNYLQNNIILNSIILFILTNILF